MREKAATPDVTRHGPDREAEVTIIGGIHGDEPAGVEVVKKLRNNQIDFTRPVQLVVGNPSAVEEDVRYLETDLNRAYPGDENGLLEEKLASEILDIIEGTKVLSLHTTHSTNTPFGIIDTSNQKVLSTAKDIPIRYCVDPTPLDGNGLSRHGDVIEVEAGRQYSQDAIEQGMEIATSFLKSTGTIQGNNSGNTPTDFFEMYETVEKPDSAPDESCSVLFDFKATNFEKVEEGDVYAEYQKQDIVADSQFYPILMSKCGYEDIFGFKGRKLR